MNEQEFTKKQLSKLLAKIEIALKDSDVDELKLSAYDIHVRMYRLHPSTGGPVDKVVDYILPDGRRTAQVVDGFDSQEAFQASWGKARQKLLDRFL